MKKTRCLIVLSGNTSACCNVISSLQFKGLKVIPPGIPLTQSELSTAYQQNRSVVCLKSAVPSSFLKEALVITVTDNNHYTQARNVLYTSSENIADEFAKIVLANNLDIGDHKSNISSGKDGPSISNCAYCQYLNGTCGANEKVLYESNNFFVLPTFGEFITGYLLIIPKQHILSNAELCSYGLAEFNDVLNDIEYILKLTYGIDNVLVWENGTGSSGTSKAKDSIVHSHVHVAPSLLTSDSIARLSQFPFENITLQTLTKYRDNSYLLIRSPDKVNWIIADSSKLYVPRQYIRQLLAEENGYLDGDFWNWRTHLFSELMHQTEVDIKSALINNWDLLSDRIKQNTDCFLY